MNYIIHPFWIYAIQLIGSLPGFFSFIGLAFILVGIVYFILLGTGAFDPEQRLSEEQQEKEDKKHIKRLKRIAICALIAFFLSGISPNQQTMIGMVIAKTATVENINYATDEVYELIDYLDAKFSD
jgi:hypothetical protein